MSANDPLYPTLAAQLADLDDGLYRIGGFCAAYRLIAPELDMEINRPSTEAFWAILDGIDATISECRAQSDAIQKAIKKEGR